MGVLVLVDDPGVLELDVQVLIDGVEDALDSQVILQLHRHLLPHQFLEVREEELPRCTAAQPPANEGRMSRKAATQKTLETTRGIREAMNYHLRAPTSLFPSLLSLGSSGLAGNGTPASNAEASPILSATLFVYIKTLQVC